MLRLEDWKGHSAATDVKGFAVTYSWKLKDVYKCIASDTEQSRANSRRERLSKVI